MSDINMRELLAAGAHFGHLTRFREPKMEPYLYGAKNKVSIINLDHTLSRFKQALKLARKIGERGGRVLFVGTKRAAASIIAEEAQRAGMPYVDHRWLGGMLTNYKTIKQSIRRLFDLEKKREDGTIDKLTKKEGLQMVRELEKLERSLGGIKDMGGLPDALFIIDVGNEKIAVQEANRLSIPVIGVVDSNSRPDGVDYLIPGNDDSRGAIRLFASKMADQILAGKETKQAQAKSKFKEEFVEVEDKKAKAEEKTAEATESKEAASDSE